MSVIDFRFAAAEALAPVLNLPAADIAAALVRPPKAEWGDLGYPCFTLAKSLKKAPPLIARDMADAVAARADFTDGPFERVAAEGPYVNFTIRMSALARASAGRVLADPEAWGRDDSGRGRTVVIDYSSPNIAKPLGVHHIRSTMIGAALSRIYAARGWRVVTVNHLGDWGTTFGQLMVSYEDAEKKKPGQPVDIEALLRLYVKFHADADDDATLNDAARAWFKRLEDGDSRARELWKVFVDESVKALKKLYARLNVSFDHYTGESFYTDKMDAVVADFRSKGLLTESDGAQVVDLAPWDMPPCLIVKRDGATTYATRDLAAARYRHDEYGFDRCLYVVANQQELHFRQLFKTLDLAGDAWSRGCEHVKFGMLSFGPGVFGEGPTTGATRKGHVVRLEEVVDAAVEKARALVVDNARDPEVTADADRLAESIGVGAVVFSEFTQRRMKDVTFTWERALNLHGDSGPYLQYTHARLSSVQRKYGRALLSAESMPWERLTSGLEREVLLSLLDYPRAVAEAERENEPSYVATYLLELSASFNRMFTDKENHRLITDDESLTQARMGLVEAARRTLASGLALLGLSAPERM